MFKVTCDQQSNHL